LSQQGMKEMQAEGVAKERVVQRYSVDLRYRGQSFTLNIPWQTIEQSIHAFHETHEVRYGHKLKESVELVNIRVSLKAPTESLNWQQEVNKLAVTPTSTVSLYGFEGNIPVWRRDNMGAGLCIQGPALIEEAVTTTLIKPNWCASVDALGHLILNYDELT